MANYVDFSNAHIECVNRAVFELNGGYIGLYDIGSNFKLVKSVEDKTAIASITNRYVGNITKNGFSAYISGKFTSSGNSFGILYPFSSGQSVTYIISNVEFESGDLFSFQINVNLAYN